MSAPLSTDQAKEVVSRVASSMQHPVISQALDGPNAVKCWSCRIGINAAAGVLIAAAIAAAVASGGTALIPEAAAIAAITGLSEAAVTAIIGSVAAGGAAGGATAVEAAIEALCAAMGACS